MTRAALPHLREQGSGHVIQVSSLGGVHAFPGLGLYHASKWTLEAFSQSLAGEVAEPRHQGHDHRAGRLLDRLGRPILGSGTTAPAYDGIRAWRQGLRSAATPGDPGPAILEIVDPEQPPLRVFFGSGLITMIRPEYEQRLANWEQWNELSQRAQGVS